MHGPRDVDATPFGWRERGAGRTPVVLLHGLSGSRLAWEPQLRGLSDEWRVVAWDQPGYGASRPLAGPVTFPALADAVARLLDALGAARAHVVGLSLGGMVAQHAAIAHPERIASLTLLSTSPAFGLDGTRPEHWRAARLEPLDAGREPADFAEEVLRAIAGPGIAAGALAEQCAAMARVPGAALRDAIGCLVTHDSRPRLHAVSAPTLVAVGRHDAETPVAYAEALAGGIAGARLEVVDGAGHLLHVEAPERVNALIRAHARAAEATA